MSRSKCWFGLGRARLSNNGACPSLRDLKGFDHKHSHCPGFGACLEVSPVHFCEHVNIECLIRNNLFQQRVLSFELFQPFGIIALSSHRIGYATCNTFAQLPQGAYIPPPLKISYSTIDQPPAACEQSVLGCNEFLHLVLPARKGSYGLRKLVDHSKGVRLGAPALYCVNNCSCQCLNRDGKGGE
jgi:hypothetical protein